MITANDYPFLRNYRKDKSKLYVACYYCIKNGFKGRRSDTVYHQRQRLKDHFSAYHADLAENGDCPQEYDFSQSSKSNKKARTID